MLKKIKKYFAMQREIINALYTICSYIVCEKHFEENPFSEDIAMHYEFLKALSKELRGDE